MSSSQKNEPLYYEANKPNAEIAQAEEVDQMDEEIPNEIQPKRQHCIVRVWKTLVPPGGLIASAFTLGSATLGAGTVGVPNAFRSMGLATSLIIIVVDVILSIFSLWLIARAADAAGVRTYPEVARILMGRGADIGAAFFLILFCLGAGVSYIITVVNLCQQLFDGPEVPAYLRTLSGRRLITSMIWLCIMFPLSLPKNIDSLRYISLLAVIFLIYLVVCIVVDSGRYLSKEGWRDDVHAFNTGNEAIVGLGSLMFACLVQMNAFEIYFEMDVATPRRMVRNSCFAMGGCGTIYIFAGIFGYARFGSTVKSSILLNYQPRQNPEMWLAFIGLIVKLCVGFCLHNIPIRDSIYYFAGWDVYRMPWWRNALFCGTLAFIILLGGLFIPNITVVLGLVGALAGGFIGFIYPALLDMYIGGWSLKSVGIVRYCMTYLLLYAGVIGVVFGTIASIYDVVVNGF